MDIKVVVATNVRLYRKQQKLSQEELAFMSDLHRTYVSGVERGIRNPTVGVLARLAKALGVQPFNLLEMVEDQSKNGAA